MGLLALLWPGHPVRMGRARWARLMCRMGVGLVSLSLSRACWTRAAPSCVLLPTLVSLLPTWAYHLSRICSSPPQAAVGPCLPGRVAVRQHHLHGLLRGCVGGPVLCLHVLFHVLGSPNVGCPLGEILVAHRRSWALGGRGALRASPMWRMLHGGPTACPLPAGPALQWRTSCSRATCTARPTRRPSSRST